MRRRPLAVLALGLLLTAVSCRRASAPAPAPPPPEPLQWFVLLEEAPGKANGATVTNTAGSQALTTPLTVVKVLNASTAPLPAAPITPEEIKRVFGEAQNALPAEELTFLFYFNEGTTVLTAQSEASLPALLRAVQERGSTLISVTGHTDSTGTSRAANQRLGLARAEAVAARLRSIGVATESLLIRSHGQDEMLVPTPPNTAEARNRRVEVIVR